MTMQPLVSVFHLANHSVPRRENLAILAAELEAPAVWAKVHPVWAVAEWVYPELVSDPAMAAVLDLKVRGELVAEPVAQDWVRSEQARGMEAGQGWVVFRVVVGLAVRGCFESKAMRTISNQ